MNIVLVGKIGSGAEEIAKRLTDYFRYEAPKDAGAGDYIVSVVEPNALRKIDNAVSFFISCGTYKRFRRCIERGDDEETILAEIMKEPHKYDSLHVDFTIDNDNGDAWAAVTEILEHVKDVVDCSHQNFTKLESCQQV